MIPIGSLFLTVLHTNHPLRPLKRKCRRINKPHFLRRPPFRSSQFNLRLPNLDQVHLTLIPRVLWLQRAPHPSPPHKAIPSLSSLFHKSPMLSLHRLQIDWAIKEDLHLRQTKKRFPLVQRHRPMWSAHPVQMGPRVCLMIQLWLLLITSLMMAL